MKKRFFIFLWIVMVGITAPSVTSAAILSLSPATDSIGIGQTVSVTVLVSSADRAMNATEGVISFSKDILEVVSISKTNSIATLWVQEPSFSNVSGTVSFESVVLNPGFTGGSGRVITITFRGKSNGVAKLSFSSSSVLANDGQGTEILTGSIGTTISVQGSAPTPVPSPSGSATGVTITSPTHPDQAKWYKDDSPQFVWTLPSGVLEIRTLIGENPKSTPNIRYAPPISSKTVENLPDGSYYFFAQVRTSEGLGTISRFQVNIDTTPPEKFRITFPQGISGQNPQPIIFFNTTDTTSGVDHYEVKIGDGKPLRTAASSESNPYTLPTQEPGTRKVTVVAFDRAGNSVSTEEDFTTEGIEPPTISTYSEEISVGELLRIRGTTYPNATVDIAVSESGNLVVIESTKSNSLGDFGIIISKRLWPGEYTFTARVINEQGARSTETKAYTVNVRFHFFTDAFAFIINYFFIMISILIGIVIIVALGIWSWFKLLLLILFLKKESAEAQSVLHRSFKILRNDLANHIKKLNKAQGSRALTDEEVSFLEEFGKDLGEAEQIIAKEVEDISPRKGKKKH